MTPVDFSAFVDALATRSGAAILPFFRTAIATRDKSLGGSFDPVTLGHTDVIERACVLWSNPGDTVFTPFMGVGSEVYGAVLNGRKGVGVELKTAYYNQAVRNMADVDNVIQHDLVPV